MVDVGGTKMMSLSINDTYFYYITWKAGEYATTAQQQQSYCSGASTNMNYVYSAKLAAKFDYKLL